MNTRRCDRWRKRQSVPLRLLLLGFACAAVTVVTAAPAQANVSGAVRVGPWLLVGSSTAWNGRAGQGVTSVTVPGRRPVLVTRGWAGIPPTLRRAGWRHIGDPGSWAGAVVDAYQQRGAATLFTVTTANGAATQYVHRLVAGESWHNSFAAPAPGGRWFVAGEWGTMHRLLVFPFPRRDSTSPQRLLALGGIVTLSRPVRDVQGCAFRDARTMLCSTNDPGSDLFPVPRQLLAVDVAGPVHAGVVRGVPRFVGALPASGLCGPGEVEGLDVTGHTLTVEVNAPCSTATRQLSFTDVRAVVADPDLPAQWVLAAQQSPAREQRARKPVAAMTMR